MLLMGATDEHRGDGETRCVEADGEGQTGEAGEVADQRDARLMAECWHLFTVDGHQRVGVRRCRARDCGDEKSICTVQLSQQDGLEMSAELERTKVVGNR